MQQTAPEIPEVDCVHQFLEWQVERSPHAVALRCEDQFITFRELNERANRLARHIRSFGTERETLVGVCLPPSIDMVVAVFAVLKAGCAYLPLDPAQLQERANTILRDAQPAIILTRRTVTNFSWPADARIVCLDADRAVVALEDASNLVTTTDATSLVHVLHTSGSTGQPKGVLGTHGGEVNRFRWFWRRFPFAPTEVACLKTSLNFIDAFSEICWPLLRGIPLVIVPAGWTTDVRCLVTLMAQHRVTRIVLVPSLLRALWEAFPDLGQRWNALRYCLSCGEPLPCELARRFRQAMPNCALINLYGSTEVSADVTYHEVTHDDIATSIPIGRPIDNVRVVLLNMHRQPVPRGETGEIYVGGMGLARGYLRQPDLTTERFMHLPFAGESDQRFYRTGDLGRILRDGNLEYLGRVDQQVKIRGFRVEPGEVEAALRSLPAIQEAVVVAHATRARSTSLMAFVTARHGTSVTPNGILRQLRQRLPAYMLPAACVMLEQMPRNEAGKIDRLALSAWDPPRSDEPRCDAPPLARDSNGTSATTSHAGLPLARAMTEERLLEIWRDVLRCSQVDPRESFFALGGDSLSALSMVIEVERSCGVRIPGEYFQEPTVQALARIVRGESLAQRPEAAAWKPRHRDELIRGLPRWRHRFRAWIESHAFRLPRERGLAWLRRWSTNAISAWLFHRQDYRLVAQFNAEVQRAAPLSPLASQARREGRREAPIVAAALERHIERVTGDACDRATYASRLRASRSPFWEPFAEIAERASLREASLERCYAFSGRDRLDSLLGSGKGVLLLTYHTPLFQLALPAVHHLGFDPVLAVAMNNVLRGRHHYDGTRPLSRVELASAVSELMHQAFTVLDQGGLLMMEGDGRKGRIACHLPIAGRLYPLRGGFAELALRAGATVVPLTCNLLNDGRIELEFHERLDAGDERGSHAERVLQLVTQYARFLDFVWRRSPESLALYRMAWHLRLPESSSRE